MAHKPRKRLGQNFLQDTMYQQRIANSIRLKEGAKCIEIGPGQGAITAHLLDRFGAVEAVEIDRDLVRLLGRKFSKQGLSIHQQDVLSLDFKQLADGKRLSIIGNLPYNISSPLLFQLMESIEVIDEMVFMLQKEVVDRITAPPGSKTYGRLSVTTGLLLNSEKLFNVPPGAFFPVPKVMSSVIKLWPKENAEIPAGFDKTLFAQIVKAAFSQRRKTIRNALSKLISEQQLIEWGVNPKARAEQLDIEAYKLMAVKLGAV